MYLEKKVTCTLTEDDVKDIVAEYLTSQGYCISPKNVEFHIGFKITGDGDVPYFKECTAMVKGDCYAKEIYFSRSE